jgi:hypothetical protein
MFIENLDVFSKYEVSEGQHEKPSMLTALKY